MSTATPPIVRRINSIDSCDKLVRSIHGDCCRVGVWGLEWRRPDGSIVARSRFERRGFTNRIEVAPAGASLGDAP